MSISSELKTNYGVYCEFQVPYNTPFYLRPGCTAMVEHTVQGTTTLHVTNLSSNYELTILVKWNNESKVIQIAPNGSDQYIPLPTNGKLMTLSNLSQNYAVAQINILGES